MTTDEWRSSTDDRLRMIESRLHGLETQSAVDEVHRTNVEERLRGIETNLGWLVKLVIGALVLGLITFALSGGLTLV